MRPLSSADTQVAVIGAGPYGLSIAAHLRHQEADFRIFGVSMQNWRTAMPSGMFLKSEGSGSNLSDPAHALTLAQHCKVSGQAYKSQGMPIALHTFVDYGLSFQRALVPDLEESAVIRLAEKGGPFELLLETGETVRSKKVVVAVGTTYFRYLPPELRSLPPELVSHSRDHADLAGFARRDVIVIGGGQSALETAALLNEQGANVRILVRAPSIAWNSPPSDAFSGRKFVRPQSPLGLGWKPWFYCHGAGFFQYLPQRTRSEVVRRALGPAGAWWLKERIIGKVPVLCRHRVQAARESGSRIRLSVTDKNGRTNDIFTDYVVAATGYKVDLTALPFLDVAMKQRIRRESASPLLSSDFESSIPGLYFAGLVAANRFGPSMRFVAGADYTARKIATALRGRINAAIAARRSPWLSSVSQD